MRDPIRVTLTMGPYDNCTSRSRDDTAGLLQYSVHPVIRELTAFDARQVGSHVCPLSLQSPQKLACNLLRNNTHPRTLRHNQIGGIDHDSTTADREIDFTWPAVKRSNWGSPSRANRKILFG